MTRYFILAFSASTLGNTANAKGNYYLEVRNERPFNSALIEESKAQWCEKVNALYGQKFLAEHTTLTFSMEIEAPVQPVCEEIPEPEKTLQYRALNLGESIEWGDEHRARPDRLYERCGYSMLGKSVTDGMDVRRPVGLK